MFQSAFSFFWLLILVGCASVGREEHLQFRSYFKSDNYQEALEKLEKSPYAQEEESELIYLLEKGMAFYQLEDFKKAIDIFQKAKEKVKQLYTISISKKAKSFITDDNSDIYYGKPFERSYLHFYTAMAYFKLHQRGNYYDSEQEKVVSIPSSQKNSALFSARSEMVAWDSFFKNIQRSRSYKTLYFNDIHAKLFAGIVHEAIGKRSEDRIALNLYNDARQMVKIIPPLYRNFNKSADKFSNDFFSYIQKNSKEESFKESSRIVKSGQLKRLEDYINLKYFSLLKKLEPSKYKKRKNEISSSIRKKINEKKNVSIILEMGMIPTKDAKDINLSLNAAFDSNYSTSQKLIALASNIAIRSFAYDVLGLRPAGLYVSKSGIQVMDHYRLGNMVNVTTPGPYLKFQVPVVESDPSNLELNIIVKKGDKTISKNPMALTSSLSEISRLNNSENMGAYLLKTGSRFLVKQGLAILGAYTTYKSLKKDGADGFAKTMAIAAYFASSAAISLGERADLRHWTTLPREIHAASIKVPEGNYQLLLEYSRGKEVLKTEVLEQVEIEAKRPYIFSYRRSRI